MRLELLLVHVIAVEPEGDRLREWDSRDRLLGHLLGIKHHKVAAARLPSRYVVEQVAVVLPCSPTQSSYDFRMPSIWQCAYALAALGM